jgi:phage tail sheath protein FI
LLGIVDLENKVDQDTQDELNPIGVNCIRKMRDGAILVWAARTLSQDRQARYVNVRRVLLAVKKFLSRSLLWTVFEPAGPALWRRVEAVLTSFLQSLYANGLASGNRPAEAFYAKCDAETNPPEVADAGQVAAEIGLALVAPAEFIVLSVRRSADAVNVVEEDV